MVEGETNVDMIQQANLAAERLEKAQAENRELLKKIELIETRNILVGRTNAGEPVTPPREETPKEYAARIMRGGI